MASDVIDGLKVLNGGAVPLLKGDAPGSKPQAAAPRAPAKPSVIGPQTQQQWVSSIKSGEPNLNALAQSEGARFEWMPEQDQYWMTKDARQPFKAPPPAQRAALASSLSPMGPKSGAGSGTWTGEHPMQLKEAVKIVTKAPPKGAKFTDTLSPEAKKAFDQRLALMDISAAEKVLAERRAKVDKRKFATVPGDILAGIVMPVAKGLAWAGEKVGIGTSFGAVEDAEEQVLQTVYKQMERKQYAAARETYNAYLKLKIDRMSDTEILQHTGDHPLLTGMTHGLAVGTAQFLILRNMPVINGLGAQMEYGAQGVAANAITGGFGTAMQTAATSRYGMSVMKMVTALAGDIPAAFVQPALNFDYHNRPLAELPSEIATEMALMIPTAFTLHAGGQAMGAIAREVYTGAAKLAGMLRALRIPGSPGVGPALERAALEQEVNLFTPLLDALNPDEKFALQQHFRSARSHTDVESRLIEMRGGKVGRPGIDFPAEPPVPGNPMQDVPGMAAKTGDKMLDVASTRAASRGEVLRTEARLAKAAKENLVQQEFETMVSDIRQFREGIRQGTKYTKDQIKAVQRELEAFIVERIPPKYRNRTVGLFKGTQTKESLARAVDKLNVIAHDISIQELGLGAERGAIKRSTKAAIKDLITNPPPEVTLIKPYRDAVWFKGLMETFGIDASDIEGKLTATHQKLFNKNIPMFDFTETFSKMKQLEKVVENEFQDAGEMVKRAFVDNLSGPAEERAYAKYAILKMMKNRADEGLTNGSAPDLGIPNNPSPEWIAQELAKITTPGVENMGKAQSRIFDLVLDNMIEAGQLDRPRANELKAKYPDYLPFLYEKYAQSTDGNPMAGKTWNLKDTNRLRSIVGGDGLEMNTNIYDTMMKAVGKSINDKHINDAIRTFRSEAGLQPLKQVEGHNGRRMYDVLVNGKYFHFDAKDLESQLIPELKGQRVLFSQFDDQAFLVPQEIYEAIMNKRPEAGPLVRTVAPLTRAWQQMTTTLRTSFAVVANPTKDLQTAIRFTKHPVNKFLKSYMTSALDLAADALFRDTSIKDMAKGADDVFRIDVSTAKMLKGTWDKTLNYLAETIGPDGWRERVGAFREGGGNQGGLFHTLSTNEFGVKEFNIKSLDPKFDPGWPKQVYRTAKGVVLMPFKTIQEIGSFFERIPRKAEFDLTLKETGSLARAGADASDVTLDFRQGGASAAVQTSRVMLPYQYTSVRGMGRMFQLLSGRIETYVPGSGGRTKALGLTDTMARVILPTLPLGVTAWMWNKATGASNYIPTYLRQNYFVFHSGMNYEDEYGNVNPMLITIRKSEIDSYLFGLIDNTLDAVVEQNPQAMSNLRKSFLGGNLVNAAITALPPWLRTPVEIEANYSFFRQQPIDPPYMKDRPYEMRKTQNTTAFGEHLGDALGIGGNMGDYIFMESAPALYDDVKFFQKAAGGKPDWKAMAEYFKIIQTPNVYFTDADLSKARADLILERRKGNRTAAATDAEKAHAGARIQGQIDALDEIIAFRQAQRDKTPLWGQTIKAPTQGVDMQRVNAFLNSPAGNARKALFNTLNPEEIETAKQLLKTRR